MSRQRPAHRHQPTPVPAGCGPDVFARQVRTELAALIVAHRYGGPLAAAAEALLELGLLDSADGQRATASRRIRHAIRLYRRVGDHAGETDATAALAAIITRKDS